MSTGKGAVAVLCCWEGNRRSGVAPAVRHSQTLSYIQLRARWQEDNHRAYVPVVVRHSLSPPFTAAAAAASVAPDAG